MPNTTNADLVQYLATKQRNVEAARATQPPAPPPVPRATQIEDLRERLSPLKPRLDAALKKLPPELVADGLTFETIAGLVKGKGGTHPAKYHLAPALFALGWWRKRVYSGMGQSTTLWWPPTMTAAETTPPSAPTEST